MKMGFKTLLKWVLPLILFISWQPLRAQTPITIYSTDTVDVCGNDKRIIVVVSLGQVLKSDSLLAFDIELKFDPAKIQFNQILTSGTLSEQFAGEISAVGDFSSVGYVRAAGGSFKDIPAVGNKPLIGFLGILKSTCADTAAVELSYTDFNPEFKKVFSDTINAKVIGRETPSFKRYISTRADNDTIRFNDSVKIQDAVFIIETTSGTRLSEGVLKLDFDKANFKASEIIPESSNISILSVGTTSTGVEIGFKKNDTISVSQHSVKVSFEKLQAANDTNVITATVKEINDCSCISSVRDSATVTAIGEKKIINSVSGEVDERAKGFIKDQAEYWEIDIPEEWKVEVYNIIGQIRTIYTSTGTRIVISKSAFKNGTYIFVITDALKSKQEVKIFNR